MRAAIPIAAALLITGCASAPERSSPLPEDLVEQAGIPGLPEARYWGDERSPALGPWVNATDDELRARYGGIMDTAHNYLVLSGGGANGAYGAGVLAGWSQAGTRPEFTIVTGVSTGALIAPFAFLGPAYDAQLEKLYTGYSSRDLVEPRSLVNFLRTDAATSTAPMRRLIEQAVDDTIIAAIAAEHRRGRGLLISTTNLDAGRPVTWNIGAIAASGAPGAASLIHDVMLASASIPVAFPPVEIAVEADGRRYTELHADGGVTSQLFLYPSALDWRRIMGRLGVKDQPTVYVIRNAQLSPQWESVQQRVLPLAGRTISTLIRSQGVGDLAQAYLNAQRDGLHFRLTFIPSDFREQSDELFDRAYMRKLFDLGREAGRTGSAWVERVEQAGSPLK